MVIKIDYSDGFNDETDMMFYQVPNSWVKFTKPYGGVHDMYFDEARMVVEKGANANKLTAIEVYGIEDKCGEYSMSMGLRFPDAKSKLAFILKHLS